MAGFVRPGSARAGVAQADGHGVRRLLRRDIRRRIGVRSIVALYGLTVDLFGEQTLAVLTTLLQAACVLLIAALVLLLSLRSVSAGRCVPVRIRARRPGRLIPRDGFSPPADQALRSSLPARAPPDVRQIHGLDDDCPPGDSLFR